MKILHCADIHLDSAMTSNLDRSKAAQRRQELLITFMKMNEYAMDNKVELILIAGDLFDTEFISGNTKQQVLSAIVQNASIAYVYIPGNHDEGNWLKSLRGKPENLYVLSEGEEYTCKDVTVLAQENAEKINFSKEGYHIVMIHGEPDFNRFAGRNIDYLALGHIHSFAKFALDSRGTACYCGCLEGRGFDETGEKGFVILDTSQKDGPRFVPFAGRRMIECQADLTGCVSNGEVMERVKQSLENNKVRRRDLVRVVLTGRIPTYLHISTGYMEQFYKEQFFLFVVTSDKLKMIIEPSVYENDISLKGTFVKKVLEMDVSEEEQRRMIELGLMVLAGEEPE